MPRMYDDHEVCARALAVLGLGEGADDDEIRAAHRRILKVTHPDHNPGPKAHLATALANEALAVLTARGTPSLLLDPGLAPAPGSDPGNDDEIHSSYADWLRGRFYDQNSGSIWTVDEE